MSCNADELALMDLIDRWHAHERDGDPEAHQARCDLELRIVRITGFLEGLTEREQPHGPRYAHDLIFGKTP